MNERFTTTKNSHNSHLDSKDKVFWVKGRQRDCSERPRFSALVDELVQNGRLPGPLLISLNQHNHHHQRRAGKPSFSPEECKNGGPSLGKSDTIEEWGVYLCYKPPWDKPNHGRLALLLCSLHTSSVLFTRSQLQNLTEKAQMCRPRASGTGRREWRKIQVNFMTVISKPLEIVTCHPLECPLTLVPLQVPCLNQSFPYLRIMCMVNL